VGRSPHAAKAKADLAMAADSSACARLTPVGLEALVRLAQVVPGDLAVHVVGDMHADVVAQELNLVGRGWGWVGV